MDADRDVTGMLNQVARGQVDVHPELVAAVYAELRTIARAHMRGQRRDHTLQATALVNEAYMRLVGGSKLDWDSRGHFFHAAAEAMRRILVEHARRNGRLKRGGALKRLPANVLDLAAASDSTETLALDEALQRLEERDPSMARLVQLRFFTGLDVEETAQVLGVSVRTVKREWAYARAWLYRELQDPGDESEPLHEGEA
jgi:RNA polymerase sigma factor (TIGR02999 family)